MLLKFLLRYLWLWIVLAIIAGAILLTMSGNDPVLPAIYR